MTTVDKKKLSASLLSLIAGESGELNKFFWHQKLDWEGEHTSEALCVGNLGCIQLPVSIVAVDKIKRDCRQATFGEGFNKSVDLSMIQAWEMDASEIKFKKCVQENIVALVVSNLLDSKICENCDVEIHLDKLVLYKPGGHNKRLAHSKKESRGLAKILLLIPCESGHEGGRLKVYSPSGNQNVAVELDDSDRLFSVTAFVPGCHTELEPITKGCLITLEFTLMSTESLPFGQSPSSLQTFLSALTQVKEVLDSWSDWAVTIQNKEKDADFEGPKSPRTIRYKPQISPVSEIKEDEVSSSSSVHWSDELSSIEEENSFYGSSDEEEEFVKREVTDNEEESQDEKSTDDEDEDPRSTVVIEWKEIICIPLQNDYSESSISFSTLSREDLLISELFKSIEFIDVHLAIVAQCGIDRGRRSFVIDFEKVYDLKERSFWVERWICSNNSIPHSTKLQLDAKKQLIGKIGKYLKRKTCKEVLKNERYAIYYHAALVIQPRKQSVYFGCRYNFEDVLSYLYSQVSSGDSSVECMTFTLGEVVSFCRKEPFHVWKDPSASPGACRAQRLLDLCTHLKAKKEGLELLAILGKNYQLDSESFAPISSEGAEDRTKVFIYEGLRDEHVASSIAEFECQVSGWNDCAQQVLDLVQSTRVVRQLTSFTSLVKSLLENGSINGSQQVADRLSSLLSELDDFTEPHHQLKCSQILSYVNMALVLEADGRMSNPKRILELFSFVCRLPSHQQCQLVIDLQKNHTNFKDIPSCWDFYQQLCRIIVNERLQDTSEIRALVIQLFECFLQMDNEELLDSLINNIFQDPPASVERRLLIEKLFLTPWTWEQPSIVTRISKLYSSARLTFFRVFDSRIHSIECSERIKEINKISSFDQPLSSDVKKTMELLTDCLRLAIFTDWPQYHVYSSYKLQKFTSSILSRLSVDVLGLLLSGLTKSECFRIKKIGSSAVNYICLQVFRRPEEEESLHYLSNEDFIKVLKRFVWMEKTSAVQSAINLICQVGVSLIVIKNQCRLIEMIFLSDDVFGDLNSIPGSFLSKKDLLELVSSLINCWAQGLIWMLDPANSESGKPILAALVKKIANYFQVCTKASEVFPDDLKLTPFSAFFGRLPFNLLFQLIVEIHSKQVAGSSLSVKGNSPYWSAFRILCQRFISHRDYDQFSSSSDASHYEILLKCFVWLEDDLFLNLICNKLCCQSEEPAVKKILDSREFLQLASTSDSGQRALSLLLDYRISALNSIVYPEPLLTWSQPDASLPDYPDIESFLRSPDEKMVYGPIFGNFSSLQEAKDELASIIKCDTSLCFEAECQECPGSKISWQICIVKVVRSVYPPPLNEQKELKEELAYLVEIRQNLSMKKKRRGSRIKGEKV